MAQLQMQQQEQQLQQRAYTSLQQQRLQQNALGSMPASVSSGATPKSPVGSKVV